MPTHVEGDLNARGLEVAIVATRFNDFVGTRLVTGAVDCLLRHGAAEDDLQIVRVPGAFELPQVTARLARNGDHDAIVCVGVLLRGATSHFDYLSREVVGSLSRLACETELPITLGVLTCDTLEQAIERAGTKAGNKGWEAALAAIELARLFARLPHRAGADEEVP